MLLDTQYLKQQNLYTQAQSFNISKVKEDLALTNFLDALILKYALDQARLKKAKVIKSAALRKQQQLLAKIIIVF